MGMLKSITLENYKCFKEATEIEIAPLTVLCGVNSSGKSSILKSLLMLKQSYEGESNSHSLLLSGKYVDNGSFDDVVYHSDKSNIEPDASFGITTSFIIRDTTNFQGKNLVKRQDIASFKELKKVFYSVGNIRKVKNFEITVYVEALRPICTESDFDFFIESNIIKRYDIDIRLLDKDFTPIDENARYIYVTKNTDTASDNTGWTIEVGGIPSTRGDDIVQATFDCTCYFSGLQIKNIYQEDMRKGLRDALPNLLSLFKIVSFQTDGIKFIAPLRQHPERRYIITGDTNTVGISGENAPIILAKEQDNYRTNYFPPTQDETGKLIWETKRESLKNSVNAWMEYFGLGDLTLSGGNGLVEINVNGHNIVDVGFGVSQAFPIIVQGLYMTKDECLLLEQPEIHLHPEMQLRMADFLIALAKNEKNVIVETHSDHFINRIIHRVMQNHEELNNIINVCIVDCNDDTTPVRIKNIDKFKGTENDKNKYFFTQYNTETRDIISTGFKNMLETKI